MCQHALVIRPSICSLQRHSWSLGQKRSESRKHACPNTKNLGGNNSLHGKARWQIFFYDFPGISVWRNLAVNNVNSAKFQLAKRSTRDRFIKLTSLRDEKRHEIKVDEFLTQYKMTLSRRWLLKTSPFFRWRIFHTKHLIMIITGADSLTSCYDEICVFAARAPLDLDKIFCEASGIRRTFHPLQHRQSFHA